jgi:catechol 2,3-dioxygenase-like lactoylglutathione lyase family enzyme
VPRPDKFSHVVIRTHDVERLTRWYQTVFDLEIHVEVPSVAAIGGYDEEHHRFAFTGGAPAPDENGRQQTTLKHTAHGFNSLEALLDQYKFLKSQDILPVETVNHGPTVSIYYEDPDGNGVEFFTERFDTMEGCKDFMRSEVFQRNLFGYYLDADVLLKQFEEGVSADEIMAYDQQQADEFLAHRMAASS